MKTIAKTSRFQIGDRVQLNQHAKDRGICQKRFPFGVKCGMVTGKSRDDATIIVQFDDNQAGHRYHESFFDPEPAQPASGFAGPKFNPKFLGNPLK